MGLLMLVVAVVLMLVGGLIQATNWGDNVGSGLLIAGFGLFVVDRLLTLAWTEEDERAPKD